MSQTNIPDKLFKAARYYAKSKEYLDKREELLAEIAAKRSGAVSLTFLRATANRYKKQAEKQFDRYAELVRHISTNEAEFRNKLMYELANHPNC